MKVVAGLGNPGPEYDDTRHNVGWWLLDRAAYEWGFPPFVKGDQTLATGGSVGSQSVRLLKPTTYMNRSGAALASLRFFSDFELTEDLLVVVDDAALDVGRVRFRAGGSPGGHRGLESVSEALDTEEFSRLRVGVGQSPGGIDLSDWVLAPMGAEDEDEIHGLLPHLVQGIRVWIEEGVGEAMNRFNR